MKISKKLKSFNWRFSYMSDESINKKCDELMEHAKYDEVIEFCDNILKKDQNSIDAKINKGYALAFLEKFESAIECYDQILKRDLNNSNALHAKCLALNRLGKYESAIECSNDILRLDKTNTYALNNKGFALGRMRKYDEALECCDEALQVKSDDQEILKLRNWLKQESESVKQS